MAKQTGITSYAINTSLLKTVMKEKGLTQQVLANMVGCSSVMIHRWVTGKSQITAKNLVKLAHATDRKACDYLEGTDKIARRYLEERLLKKIVADMEAEELPDLDDDGVYKIMKVLGYEVGSTAKSEGSDESGFSVPVTDAETQMGEFI